MNRWHSLLDWAHWVKSIYKIVYPSINYPMNHGIVIHLLNRGIHYGLAEIHPSEPRWSCLISQDSSGREKSKVKEPSRSRRTSSTFSHYWDTAEDEKHKKKEMAVSENEVYGPCMDAYGIICIITPKVLIKPSNVWFFLHNSEIPNPGMGPSRFCKLEEVEERRKCTHVDLGVYNWRYLWQWWWMNHLAHHHWWPWSTCL